MNRFFFTLALLALVSFSTFAQSAEVIQGAQKFERFLDFIDDKYLEEVDLDKAVEDAIKQVLEDLDPHSNYFSAEELRKANEPLVGNFEGIGIQFNILKDTILVVSTISGGPSEKVGLMAGDKILTVDEEPVAGIGIKNKGVMDLLRGKKGTKVTVGVMRNSRKGKTLDFTITRDKIPLFSVDAGYMIDESTGYIKINRFSSTTVREFREALVDLKASGMEELILDLRGNSGGYLNAALELSNEFLDGRKLITYTEGRAYPRQDFYTDNYGGWTNGRLVVLINEGSASASEIVTGAVQDWDRGLVIGRRSFGKGLVQRPFMLPDESAIRLTVQRYYTPSGRSIQRSYEEGAEDYYLENSRRLESGELTGDSDIEFPDSLKFYTNARRVVYGGGGIMPDIFMALDTSFVSDFYDEVIGKGILNQFGLEYINKNREAFKEIYASSTDFAANYEVDKITWKEFIAYAKEEGLSEDVEGEDVSRDRVEMIMRAIFARNLWNTEAYFKVINREDETMLKAFNSFRDDTFDRMKIAAK